MLSRIMSHVAATEEPDRHHWQRSSSGQNEQDQRNEGGKKESPANTGDSPVHFSNQRTITRESFRTKLR
jgi:hypothetical protein